MPGDYPPDHRSWSARSPQGGASDPRRVGWSATPETDGYPVEAADETGSGHPADAANEYPPDDRRFYDADRADRWGAAHADRRAADRGPGRSAAPGADPGEVDRFGPAEPTSTFVARLTTTNSRMTGLLRKLEDRRNRPDERGRHPDDGDFYLDYLHTSGYRTLGPEDVVQDERLDRNEDFDHLEVHRGAGAEVDRGAGPAGHLGAQAELRSDRFGSDSYRSEPDGGQPRRSRVDPPSDRRSGRPARAEHPSADGAAIGGDYRPESRRATPEPPEPVDASRTAYRDRRAAPDGRRTGPAPDGAGRSTGRHGRPEEPPVDEGGPIRGSASVARVPAPRHGGDAQDWGGTRPTRADGARPSGRTRQEARLDREARERSASGGQAAVARGYPAAGTAPVRSDTDPGGESRRSRRSADDRPERDARAEPAGQRRRPADPRGHDIPASGSPPSEARAPDGRLPEVRGAARVPARREDGRSTPAESRVDPAGRARVRPPAEARPAGAGRAQVPVSGGGADPVPPPARASARVEPATLPPGVARPAAAARPPARASVAVPPVSSAPAVPVSGPSMGSAGPIKAVGWSPDGSNPVPWGPERRRGASLLPADGVPGAAPGGPPRQRGISTGAIVGLAAGGLVFAGIAIAVLAGHALSGSAASDQTSPSSVETSQVASSEPTTVGTQPAQTGPAFVQESG